MDVPITVGEITVTAQKREEDIQDVPVSVSTLQGEDLDVITTGGADVRALVGPRAQPDHGVVVRPRLPAFLHPRSRQHRFRPQRLAAGVDGGRRGRAREPGRQGHAALRPRSGRGAARTPGHPLRPQYTGRYRQVRHRQTVAGLRRLRPGVLRHLLDHRHPGRCRRFARRRLVGPVLGSLPVAQRLGEQQVRGW